MAQRYLRKHLGSGRYGPLLIYTDRLARRGDTFECDEEGRIFNTHSVAAVDEPPPEPRVAKTPQGKAPDEGGEQAPPPPSAENTSYFLDDVPLDEADKAKLAEYAEKHFGVKLDKRKGEDALREEVRGMIDGLANED